MFPIFLWIDDYRCFKDFQINFDPNYRCSLKKGKGIATLNKTVPLDNSSNSIIIVTNEHYEGETLTIEELKIEKIDNDKYIKGFYGENIDSVNIIAGKNGTGKSSILEFLTLDRDQKNKYNYIVVYKTDYEDSYYIEGNLDAIFPIEALNFLKNKAEVAPNRLTNIFTFYMNGSYEINQLAQYNVNTRRGVIGRLKFDIDNFKTDNSREKIEVERFNSSYSVTSYEGLYTFLSEIYNTSFYSHYRDIKIIMTFNKGLIDLYDNNIKYEGDSDKVQSIIDFFEEIDITEGINFDKGQDIILKTFCNDLYIHLLRKKLNEEWDKINLEKSSFYKTKVINDLDSYIEKIKATHNSMKKQFISSNIIEVLEKLSNYDEHIKSLNTYDSTMKIYHILVENNLFNDTEKLEETFEITGNVTDSIVKLLNYYDSYSLGRRESREDYFEIFKFFKIEKTKEVLSDGEKNLLNLFSTIHSLIPEYGDYEEKDDTVIQKKYITLLIDEPELTLHPEWSRQFISKLLESLKNYLNLDLYKDIKFKIIIATHSPYLLADVQDLDVILLKKKEGPNPVISSPQNNTFGANILDIYKSSFFLDSTFGEFAKRKIESIIKDLSDKENIKILSEVRKDEIRKTIDLIGEPLIRTKLDKMYRDVFTSYSSIDKLKTLLEQNEITEEDIHTFINTKKGEIN